MVGILAVQGDHALTLNDVWAAQRCVAEALEIACELGLRLRLHELLNICAYVALESGRQVSAARLFGAVAHHRSVLALASSPVTQKRERQAPTHLERELGESSCARYVAEGVRWTEEHAIEFARALVRNEPETVRLRLA